MDGESGPGTPESGGIVARSHPRLFRLARVVDGGKDHQRIEST